MKPLVLDTHAWLWLAMGDPRLGKHVSQLEKASSAGQLLLPSIAAYEAAVIGVETQEGKRTGKRALRMLPTVEAWVRTACEKTGVVCVPLEVEEATVAAMQYAMHGDPFDRLIVATALRHGGKLVTADEKILSFAKAAHVPVLELA